MRRIFYFLLILSNFWACHTDDGKVFTYSVINESGKNITVTAFNRNDKFREPVITKIDNGEDIVKEYEADPPSKPNGYSYTAFFQGDSIVVRYANERRQIFVEVCGENEENPLNFCLFNGTKETFVFNQEGYDDAAPCDGEYD